MKKIIKILTVFVAVFLFITPSFASLVSIKEAQNQENKTMVIIKGTITQLKDTDEFLLKDETSEIKVELDDDNPDQILFIRNNGVAIGNQVVVEGILKKEMFEKDKIKVTRIQIFSKVNKDPFQDAVTQAKGM